MNTTQAVVIDINWTNGLGGEWGESTNWDSDPLIPGSSDTVVFDLSGSYTVDFDDPAISPTIANLDIKNDDVTFDLGIETLTVSNDTDLALSATDIAFLRLTSGTLRTTNLNSGVFGESLFDIRNGSTAIVTSPLTVTIGVNTGSDGKLAIDGVGSQLQFQSTGQIIVGNSGQGTFHVHNGATPTIDAEVIVGKLAGSTNSEITVDDASGGNGSTLSINDLTLSDVSGVTTTLDIIEGSDVSADIVIIGNNGTATAFVEGQGADNVGSTMTVNDLAVGLLSGSNGLLHIQKAADVTVNNDTSETPVLIAGDPGSLGQIYVDGTTGGQFTPTQLDIEHDLVVGGYGDGILRLDGSPGSAIVDVGNDLIAGFFPGSTGYIEVGENSTLNANGQFLGIGVGGQGTLNIIGGSPVGGKVFADEVHVGAVGPSGPTSQITIDYNAELTANTSLIITETGVVEMISGYSGRAKLTSPTINNYGLFQGAGDVIVDPETTFHNYGTIAPEPFHSLDVDGDFVFESGSIFEVIIFDGIDNSVLNIDGDLTFSSGFLDVIFDGGEGPGYPGLGDMFTVLTWTGSITGAFASIDNEFNFNGTNLAISSIYNANSLVLEVVPEPSTWALMGMGCLFIFWRFRRRS